MQTLKLKTKSYQDGNFGITEGSHDNNNLQSHQ